jgi:Domain of unknown function (DUF4156)
MLATYRRTTMQKLALMILIPALMSACTWVEPDAGGKAVQVVYGKTLTACTSKGEITVSVKHKVGIYRRNDMKVRDELESLARNEAAHINADTIQSIDEPLNGEQRFAAYRCR